MMTSKERFSRMFAHKEADRVPIIDSPWQGTIARWRREGMPAGAAWQDYFQVDKTATISVNVTPRYPVKVLEETDRYRIETSEWGVTMKHFKEEDSTPEYLDFTITTPESWAKAKERMAVSKDRVDWKFLEENYPKWKSEGRWLNGEFWFGFDVTHSWVVGTETLLVAMLEEPEWITDMFNTNLENSIALMDMVWDAGYTFDTIFWYDDMGYKNATFFSLDMYKKLLMPYHKRAIEWAHSKGIYAHLHSCGGIMSFIPTLVDMGLDALNPLEVKAGMDAEKIKREFGDKLTLHGGINAVLWDDKDSIIAEVERIVPILKQNGGYIFSSDHSIPNTVSLDTFREIVATVKRVGSY